MVSLVLLAYMLLLFLLFLLLFSSIALLAASPHSMLVVDFSSFCLFLLSDATLVWRLKTAIYPRARVESSDYNYDKYKK